MKKRAWLAGLVVFAFVFSFIMPRMIKADEVEKISVHTIGGEPEKLADVQAAINEYLAPMGLEVEYHYHDWGVFADDTSRMINSGEEWDVMFGSSIKGVQEFAQNGSFAYLNDLLEQTPKLRDYIPKELWEGVSYKGQIFGVPALKDSAAAQYWIFDKAIVEKAGVDVKTIKTMKDIDGILPKIKEALADEPGRYPFVLANDGINSMLCEFEMNKAAANIKFGTTEAINLYKDPEVVERFKLLREWQEKGFINPDANQKTYDQIAAGSDAIASGQGWDGAEVIWSHGAKHPVVTNLRYGPILTGDSIRGSFTVINAASEHQLAALKYLELVNTDPKLRNMLAYGREGQEYEVVKEAKGSDGSDVKFEAVDGVDNVIKRLGEAKEDGNIDNGYAVPAYSQGGFEFLHIWLNTQNPELTDPMQFKRVVEQTHQAEASKVLGLQFNRAPVEGELAAVESVVEKYYANLMTGLGDKPVEEMLNDMYAELDTAGLPKVLEELQKQIDEYLAGQKK